MLAVCLKQCFVLLIMDVLYRYVWMLCSSLVCFNTHSHWSVSASMLCIANQCSDVTWLNVPFTATQCSAGKSKAVALASSTALRLAATLCQLTTLGNRWKLCPENVPSFFSYPILQDPVFLVYVLLIDTRCSLPDRQHVLCAPAELLELAGLLHMVSAF